MNSMGARAVIDAEVLSLVYELLDAHTDTIALGSDLVEELRWEVHLDYLRALQRKGQEMVARWRTASGVSTPR